IKIYISLNKTSMKRNVLLFVALAAVLGTGCVSQKKYKKLEASHQQLQQSTRELRAEQQECQSKLTASTTRVNSIEEQLASERSNVAALQAALDKCLTSTSQGNVNIAKLVDEIKSSNQYIQHLINAKHKSDSLLMVLTNNLTRSLSREEMQDV